MLGSSRKIAWKTGTSFGFRDGWSIGVTPDYAIGVWVGNADGEGRPGLTGINTAAPILFDVAAELPNPIWFDPPYDEMVKVPVCLQSGHRAGRFCDETDSVFVPQKGLRTQSCPYHQRIHLDKTGQYRVTGECADVYDMQHQSWFVLPPVVEWYYKRFHPEYEPLPPFASGCRSEKSPMEMIHPKSGAEIYIPVDIDGASGKVVFRAAHRNEQSTVYWHLDREYIGKTENKHEMALNPDIGQHTIHLVDERGNALELDFTIVDR
jgi:penicillin-binding protein 1C